MSKAQLTLEAASPGGRVRKRAYDVATIPPDESAADRAKRKSANRSSALRARKALAQMLTEEPPPATAPPVALDLVPPSTDQKRSRRRMPGVRRGSKLSKKSLLEQSAALDLADAMGCDPDEVDDSTSATLMRSTSISARTAAASTWAAVGTWAAAATT